MCGIAGIAKSSYSVDITSKNVASMCRIMRHRGPDNTTVSSYPHVVFGHNRLSLIDLSDRSNQPFENESSALVFNGEIYNYLELKADLIKTFDQKFTTTSDTEVLFFGLINWGIEQTLKKLKGMFAFAFYDFASKKVYCARDRTGMKPFFYSVRGSQLVFSSELKAIWALDDYSTVNEKYISLATFAEFEYSRKISALTGVHQLEPGTFLIFDVDTGTHTTKTYFKMADYLSIAEFERRNKSSKQEVFEEFEGIFTNTLHKVMAADAKMGAFVSGGVDSSLCAGIAFQKDPVSLFTSNVVGKHSELENSSLLANVLNTQLNKHDFTPDMFLKSWAKTTWYYESPILAHSNAVPFQHVSELARQHSCKAVLTGEGSDELFLGYPRLLTRRFDKFLLAPINLINSVYKKVPGLSRYLNLDKTNFHQDFAQFLTGAEALEKEEANLTAYSFLNDQDKALDQAMTLNMLERSIHSLLWRNDRMGMMHSIESRFPFLYEDMLEFAVNLPVKFKVGKSHKFHNFKHPFHIDKVLVRELAAKVLNEKLGYIQKKGFPVHGLMNVKVDSSFFENGFWQEQLGLSNSVLKLIQKNYHPYLLAKLASVEIWGSLFFKRQSIEEVESRISTHIKLNY